MAAKAQVKAPAKPGTVSVSKRLGWGPICSGDWCLNCSFNTGEMVPVVELEIVIIVIVINE